MTHDNNNNHAANAPLDAAPHEATQNMHEDQDIFAAHPQPEFPATLPVLPLRDVVIYNYTIIPLFVGRDASIQAVEAALAGSRYLMVLTQKDETVDNPAAEDLHTVGTIAMIMRMLKLPDGRMKLLVQGVSRAKALNITNTNNYLETEIEVLPEQENYSNDIETEALIRTAKEQSERILNLKGMTTSPEVAGILSTIHHPGKLADLIASNLRLNVPDAQHILATLNPVERLRLVVDSLTKEAEVASMQAHIQESAREGMDKAQRDYFLREQLKAIKKELGEAGGSDDDETDELVQALKKAKLPPHVEKEAQKQLRRLLAMHAESSEAAVIRTYLEWLAELPWAKLSRDRLDIVRASEILDDDHYGLEKVKERILEFLSIKILNTKAKSPILCFVGPPGVGKTSLGKSIAKALNRKFQRMSVGGVRDEAEIRGHRRTYVGALPGRIIQSIKQAGTRNPVIMLDEIDKLGADYRGDPSSALLEVLDPEQNNSFSDHYLHVPFDLSKVVFICTANNLDTIPRPLLDRMEIIRIPGYTMQEKVNIASKYLLPRQIIDNGLKVEEITFDADVIENVISGYTREAGVRSLERELGTICRKFARKKASKEKPPFVVTAKELDKYLGAVKYADEELDANPTPGNCVGLAWTPYGGEILNIEVTAMKGKGSVQLTGQLGDVMKESAQAAISFARTNAVELGINPDFNSELDIHIHVPAGATPKDGPSAGVTLATALISCLTNTPVRPNLCMTGEITLRGKVLPVGGIKEKVIAAVARGRKDVIIPQQNVKDLEEIPQDVLKKITVNPVTTIQEVLAIAFAKATTKTKAAVKTKATAKTKVK